MFIKEAARGGYRLFLTPLPLAAQAGTRLANNLNPLTARMIVLTHRGSAADAGKLPDLSSGC
jgi:hypothetical protein